MDDKGMRESERVSVSPAREVDSSGLLLTIMVLMFAVGIPALLYGLVNGLGMRGRPLTHGSMVEGIVYTLSFYVGIFCTLVGMVCPLSSRQAKKPQGL